MNTLLNHNILHLEEELILFLNKINQMYTNPENTEPTKHDRLRFVIHADSAVLDALYQKL